MSEIKVKQNRFYIGLLALFAVVVVIAYPFGCQNACKISDTGSSSTSVSSSNVASSSASGTGGAGGGSAFMDWQDEGIGGDAGVSDASIDASTDVK